MSLFTTHTDRHDEDRSRFWHLPGNAPKMDYNVYCVRMWTIVMCVFDRDQRWILTRTVFNKD